MPARPVLDLGQGVGAPSPCRDLALTDSYILAIAAPTSDGPTAESECTGTVPVVLTYITVVAASDTASAAASAGPTVTDWITAICAIVTTVIALVAALYARRQWSVARQAREDAQAAEVERSQPYVAVFLEVGGPLRQNIDLVVQNFGATGAYKVSCGFTTRLQRTNQAFTSPTGEKMDFSLFDVPEIPFLAPGQQWRTWFDTGTERFKDSSVPETFQGWVHYRGLKDVARRHEVLLDFRPLSDAMTKGDTEPAQLVVEAIDRMTTAIGRRAAR